MNEMKKRKRITVKLSFPNPLFEKWLTEWRDEAAERQSKLQHVYSSALHSLQKYPLPLQTGKDCKVLRGFGDKLCKMLDEKLQEHITTRRTIDQEVIVDNIISLSNAKVKRPKESLKEDNSSQNSNVREYIPQVGSSLSKENLKRPKESSKKDNSSLNNNSREYIPQVGSGPYAILIMLYKASLEQNYPGYSRKNDIVSKAQIFCSTSFTKPEPDSRYTAWSSMKTLINKNLVHKESNPAKYSLTEDGLVLACRLYSVSCDSDGNGHSSTKVQYMKETITSSKMHKTRFDKITIITSEDKPGIESTKQMENSSKISSKQTSSSLTSGYSSNSITSQCSTESNDLETVFLTPNSFDIILLVDTQETSGTKTKPVNDPIIHELEKRHVQFEVRHLKVGDYAWICKQHASNIELVLPYIVERKRMDDFGKSIKDGRFHEQKFRLKQCGVQNVIYLIEGYGNNEHTGLPLTTLYQAATNTMVQDNFTVKMTENLKETAAYLSCFTALMNKYFKMKTLMSCSKDNLTPSTLEDDLIPLLTFKEFSRTGSKNKELTVKDLFVRQLLQIKGMSVEKALAIVEKYPTPRHLKNVYSEKTTQESEKLLSCIQFGKLKKKIGPVLSKIVFQLYSMKSF